MGGTHRRFASRTREDVEILNALPPAKAREFDRLLQQQHRSNARHRSSCRPDSPSLERLRGEHNARYSHGAGGGRRKPKPPADE